MNFETRAVVRRGKRNGIRGKPYALPPTHSFVDYARADHPPDGSGRCVVVSIHFMHMLV